MLDYLPASSQIPGRAAEHVYLHEAAGRARGVRVSGTAARRHRQTLHW